MGGTEFAMGDGVTARFISSVTGPRRNLSATMPTTIANASAATTAPIHNLLVRLRAGSRFGSGAFLFG